MLLKLDAAAIYCRCEQDLPSEEESGRFERMWRCYAIFSLKCVKISIEFRAKRRLDKQDAKAAPHRSRHSCLSDQMTTAPRKERRRRSGWRFGLDNFVMLNNELVRLWRRFEFKWENHVWLGISGWIWSSHCERIIVTSVDGRRRVLKASRVRSNIYDIFFYLMFNIRIFKNCCTSHDSPILLNIYNILAVLVRCIFLKL